MANKRVIDMQELSELGDGWYTFLDSATGGTKKFDMGNMLNATADAQDAAEAAQSAATSAREAADGVVSPTVTPSQITGGTRVTITDVDGTRTFDVMDGPQGEKGDTGDPAAPGSITTDMLADEAVTHDKLAPGVADGYQPKLVSGSSRAMLGGPETASWMERTTAADGAALIESICGNTLRWNQLRAASDGLESQTINDVTFTKDNDGSVTVSGTPTANGNLSLKMIPSGSIPSGHKVLVRNACPAGGSSSTYYAGIGGSVADTGNGGITTFNTTATTYFRFDYRNGVTIPETKLWPQMFDLTAMFGAGNEPATVAEFEALFPEPYYPYDAGSLLPVRMEGVETVGFNQWDEVWEVGGININDGTDVAMANRIRGKNYIPVFPATTYFFGIPSSTSGNVHFYDADRGFISQVYKYNETFTTPSNCRFIRFAIQPTYGTTYKNDICINLSDPSRNGTYEPHWSSKRTIPAATYFPDGMRSAGTVYDELTATQAITRVGERAYQSGDESDPTVVTDGTITHYALATPTTTTIDPPLPLSYRVGAGGTECVMVASGTTSAPPIFATRYPLDPADLAASIAPVDGPTAKTNHQVGDLIMLGFTLCKATQVIVTGETIAIGTNVTRTSVAAELAALSE